MFQHRLSEFSLLWHEWLIAGGVVFLDQVSKFLWQPLSWNRGVAFSLELGSEFFQLLITLAAFVLLLIFSVFQMQKTKNRWERVVFPLILGGAFSNLVDRFWFGAVRDIWKVPGIGVENNLADWAIMIGVSIWLMHEIIHLWNRHR